MITLPQPLLPETSAAYDRLVLLVFAGAMLWLAAVSTELRTRP